MCRATRALQRVRRGCNRNSVHSAKCGSTSGHEHQAAQAARPAQLTPAVGRALRVARCALRVARCVALGIVRCNSRRLCSVASVANRPLRVACGIFGRCMLHLCGVPSAAGLHVAYRPSTTCFCACVRACNYHMGPNRRAQLVVMAYVCVRLLVSRLSPVLDRWRLVELHWYIDRPHAPAHICTGTWLTLATFAPGLGSPPATSSKRDIEWRTVPVQTTQSTRVLRRVPEY